MMDRVGKVFTAYPPLRRCLVCDLLFTREASREHSTQTCFPVPSACPPIRYGVAEGQA
jgi:hypothetical protein